MFMFPRLFLPHKKLGAQNCRFQKFGVKNIVWNMKQNTKNYSPPKVTQELLLVGQLAKKHAPSALESPNWRLRVFNKASASATLVGEAANREQIYQCLQLIYCYGRYMMIYGLVTWYLWNMMEYVQKNGPYGYCRCISHTPLQPLPI